jgi:NDP-sugar pyrophosphorylase family protein
MQAVILAGGRGTRLQPYTFVFPKPMLPVGGHPIIDTIVRQLAYFGFDDIVICLGYLGDYIRMYFSDETNVPDSARIRFVAEDEPLGTAGPVALVPELEDDFLVINGDILTTIDYRQFVATHKEKGADLSVSVRIRDIKMSLGLIEMNEARRITGFKEKPTFTFYDNMGIYVYNKRVMQYIKPEVRLDVNELIEVLLEHNGDVYGYLSQDEYYWIDVGQHSDYEAANREFEKRRHIFVREPNHQ